MITSIKNKDYSELFKEAAAELLRLDAEGKISLLKEEKDYFAENESFTSLEQYFTRLGTLVSYAENPIKYLMLPMDEPCLEVNANSRIIEIPPDFKKYGVSVQGDVIAETLFLRIDRFFDSMDFLEPEAYIQWKLKDGTEGVSKIPYVDFQSEHTKGKLILVWPLTGAITAQEGPVQFSLRFLKKKGEEVIYSWNTVPATITIKGALKPEVNYGEIDNAANLFAAAIEDSKHTSDGDEVDPPSFEIPAGMLSNLDTNVLTIHKEYLNPDNELTLKGQAWIADQGRLSYSWTYDSIDGNVHVADGELMNGESIAHFEETVDDSPVENKTYYVKNDSALPYGYEEINADEFADIKLDGTRKIYERFAILEINPDIGTAVGYGDTVTGIYQLCATHKLGFDSEDAKAYVKIPGPEKLKFTSGKDIIGKNDKDEDIVLGKTGIDSNNLFIDEDNNLTITVNVENDDAKATAYQSMQYYWTRRDDSKTSTPTEVQNSVTFNKTASGAEKPPVSNTLTLEDALPGWYQVIVTSMLNRDSISIESDTIRVTKDPEPPVLTFKEGEDELSIDFKNKTVERPDEVDVVIDESTVKINVKHEDFTTPTELYSDELIYCWYDNNDIDITSDDYEYKDFIIVDKGTVTIDAVSLDRKAIFLHCEVINSLNGKNSSVVKSGTYLVYC